MKWPALQTQVCCLKQNYPRLMVTPDQHANQLWLTPPKTGCTKSLNTKGKLIHFLLDSFNDETEQKSTLNCSSQLWKPISEVPIRYNSLYWLKPTEAFIILNLLCLHNCVMQTFRQQKPFNSSGAPLVHTAAILDAILLQFNYQNDFRSLKIWSHNNTYQGQIPLLSSPFIKCCTCPCQQKMSLLWKHPSCPTE